MALAGTAFLFGANPAIDLRILLLCRIAALPAVPPEGGGKLPEAGFLKALKRAAEKKFQHALTACKNAKEELLRMRLQGMALARSCATLAVRLLPKTTVAPLSAQSG